MIRRVSYLAFFATLTLAQEVRIREVDHASMPGSVDSNSPGFWRDGIFHLFNSTGNGPVLSRGSDQLNLSAPIDVELSLKTEWPTWIESVWVDPGGPIFAFYHQEDFGVCPGRLSHPSIGVLVSYDEGESFADLGIVLSSGEPPNCASQNGYFSGGHGDVSVITDPEGEYFYFFFGNYGGPLETQGVVVARLAVSDRFSPVGKVWKYYNGGWTEQGLRGRTTPVFGARVEWQRPDTDAFWGPAIHWNTHLQTYVMLMNRSCCSPGWPQENIYITFNSDLSNPAGWTEPTVMFPGFGWYPQVIGLGAEETDTVVGQKARLWIYGESEWEIEFHLPGMAPAEEQPVPQPSAPAPDPMPEPTPDPASQP